MAVAVELPHLEGDFAALVVGLGRLIPFVQLADLVVDRRWGEFVGTQRTQRRSSARYQSLMCVQVGRQGAQRPPSGQMGFAGVRAAWRASRRGCCAANRADAGATITEAGRPLGRAAGPPHVAVRRYGRRIRYRHALSGGFAAGHGGLMHACVRGQNCSVTSI